jgi:UDP-glucose:(heptosyl)LPS alpha-1,3-glucosyltransferase
LKIALVCRHYTLNRGGLERYTVNLSRLLLSAGHEIHVFGHTFDGPQGIRFHRVPMLELNSPAKNLTFAYFCRKRIQTAEYAIVHSMERILAQDIYRVSDGINPVLLRCRYGNPVLRLYKSITPRRLAISFLERKIFQAGGCRLAMTNSKLIKSHLERFYGMSPDRIAVIYNGVDTGRFNTEVRARYRQAIRDRLAYTQRDIVMVFVSNNFKLKGLSSVIRAMHLLRDRKFRLLVVGNDDPRPYRDLIDRLSLPESIRFLGAQRSIEKIYACGDMFILPTAYEPFANVCLEAMACGLPVITTASNGASEIITPGKSGYVLDTDSPEASAEKIAGLETEISRSEMGRQAAETAVSFTWENHLSALLKLYQNLERKPRPPEPL